MINESCASFLWRVEILGNFLVSKGVAEAEINAGCFEINNVGVE